MDPKAGPALPELKKQYLLKAVEEYEYSLAPEYDKERMTSRAATAGTIDFSYDNPERDVELSGANIGVDGAWVTARVWVPKDWLDSN